MGNDVNLFFSVLLSDLSGFLWTPPIKYLFSAMIIALTLRIVADFIRAFSRGGYD